MSTQRLITQLPPPFAPADDSLPDLPALKLAEYLPLIGGKEITLHLAESSFPPEPHVVAGVLLTPTMSHPHVGVCPFDDLPPGLRDTLAKLLYARPAWSWRFGLASTGHLTVEAVYICECAARERLRAATEVGPWSFDKPEIMTAISEDFYRAHDRNIEAHTATWRRTPLTFEVGQYARMTSSRILSACCQSCGRELYGDVYLRSPGIQPPGKPSPAPTVYCLRCGERARLAH